jgi:putative transposase
LQPHAVFFYVRYGVSYRDLEEIMEERGVNVDHATLNRWVIRYSPTIAVKAEPVMTSSMLSKTMWMYP